LVGYPNGAEEVEIVQRMGVAPPRASEVLGLHELVELQAATDRVYVDRSVVDYAVNVVLATRDPAKYGLADLTSLVSYGASPRASEHGFDGSVHSRWDPLGSGQGGVDARDPSPARVDDHAQARRALAGGLSRAGARPRVGAR